MTHSRQFLATNYFFFLLILGFQPRICPILSPRSQDLPVEESVL